MESKEPTNSNPPKDEENSAKIEGADIENVGDEASGSSWWSASYSSWVDKAVSSVASAVDVAKNKSNTVYGMVAKDLEEVTSQANSMVRSTSTTLKKTLEDLDEKSDVVADKAFDTVKKSVTSAWKYAAGYTTQMFVEDDLDAEAILVGAGGDEEPVALNRLQAQLYALASDPDTFLSDPKPEDVEASDLASFACDLDSRQGEISDLMVTNRNIRKNFSALVPDQVTHKLFWTRYFQKVHLVELMEKRRQKLKLRAADDADDVIDWDEVTANDTPIPDDVQDRLLSEYEREIIESKMKKATDETKTSTAKLSKQSSPDKDETSSEDWEKLSSGEKSPKKSVD